MTDYRRQRQPADAGSGNNSARRRESERMRGMINVAPNASAAGT